MNLHVQNKRFREEPEYLVKRLRESDENAFAFLLDTYGKSLYFYCNSILKNDTFAEDIVQESFVRLWERRKKEIADTLSVSIHTVKTQKQRAMSVLKRRFGIGTILVMFGMTDFFI